MWPGKVNAPGFRLGGLMLHKHYRIVESDDIIDRLTSEYIDRLTSGYIDLKFQPFSEGDYNIDVGQTKSKRKNQSTRK